MEHIRTWTRDDYQLDLWDTGKRQEASGKSILNYVFWHHGKVIFHGSEYCPSPLHCTDSDDSVASLLSFLSCGDGDTDDEFFEDYTPEQIAWRDEFAEDLSLIVYDMENE